MLHHHLALSLQLNDADEKRTQWRDCKDALEREALMARGKEESR